MRKNSRIFNRLVDRLTDYIQNGYEVIDEKTKEIKMIKFEEATPTVDVTGPYGSYTITSKDLVEYTQERTDVTLREAVNDFIEMENDEAFVDSLLYS